MYMYMYIYIYIHIHIMDYMPAGGLPDAPVDPPRARSLEC